MKWHKQADDKLNKEFTPIVYKHFAAMLKEIVDKAEALSEREKEFIFPSVMFEVMSSIKEQSATTKIALERLYSGFHKEYEESMPQELKDYIHKK